MSREKAGKLNHEPRSGSLHVLLALKIRSLIADKEMIVASANRDITQYGEWRTDYNAWHMQTESELQALLSEANTEISHADKIAAQPKD
jgi:hypothetical protein